MAASDVSSAVSKVISGAFRNQVASSCLAITLNSPLFSSWLATAISRPFVGWGSRACRAAPEEPSFEEVGDELADLVRVADRIKAEQKWDKEHTYVIDIIRILHGQIGIRKMDLDAALREKRVADKEPYRKLSIRRSKAFSINTRLNRRYFAKRSKRANHDLFYSRKESTQERGHCVRMSVPGIG